MASGWSPEAWKLDLSVNCMTDQYNMVSGFVSTPGNYQELISDILRHKMNKIEVTPEKVITMRLGEVAPPVATIHPRFRISAEYILKPKDIPRLPRYSSMDVFFDGSYPWWTLVQNVEYVPEMLLWSMLDRKRNMKDETAKNESSFKVNRLKDLADRYGMTPRTKSSGQQLSFFERPYAEILMANLAESNQSGIYSINRIGYEVKEYVEPNYLLNVYSEFLFKLDQVFSNRANQARLAKYFTK